MGWYDYLNLRRGVYEDLVRIFYLNGTTSHEKEDDDNDVVSHDDPFLTFLVEGSYVITPFPLQKVLKLKLPSRNAITFMGEENAILKE